MGGRGTSLEKYLNDGAAKNNKKICRVISDDDVSAPFPALALSSIIRSTLNHT